MNTLCLALAIYPVNPSTAAGWKIDFDYDDVDCQYLTGDEFIECVEGMSYVAEDVLINHNSSQFTVTDFYSQNWDGIVLSVEMHADVITSNYDSTMDWLWFNSSVSYTIYIMDTKLQFVTANPNIIPRSLLTLKENAGTTNLYVKAIRHEKLNRPGKPCEPSPEYSFATCLEESAVDTVGCQPPWSRFFTLGQSLCDNWTILQQYGERIWNLHDMDRNELFEATNCLMPCTFMEYKESPKHVNP